MINNKIKERALYPITRDLIYLILIWLMISGSEFLIQFITGHFLSGFLFIVMGFGLSYILVFLVDSIRKFSRFLRPLLFVYLSIFTLLNVYFIYRYHTRLNINFLEIIAGTNPTEIREYLQMYVGWEEYAGIIVYIIVMCILYRISHRKINLKIKNSPFVPIVIVATSVLAFFLNPALKAEIPVWNFNIEDIVDLRKYKSDYELECQIDSLPQTVVVILGESHSPRKTSLYGYDLQTSPLLSERNKKGNLIVFENVKSPCTNTSQAFRYILNAKVFGDDDETPWYKTVHLVDVLNKAGYTTTWISNQALSGLYNNLSSASADLCDSAIFLRNYWEDKIYDGALADISLNNNEKNAIFYHLMGQHVMFKERFPVSFSYFTAEDYPQQPSGRKREILADYDNATLYNMIIRKNTQNF